MIQELLKKSRISYLEFHNSEYSKKIKNIQAEIKQINSISDQTLDAIQIGITNNIQYEKFAEKSKAHQQFYEFHRYYFSDSEKTNIQNIFEERKDELEAEIRNLNNKISENKEEINKLLSELGN